MTSDLSNQEPFIVTVTETGVFRRCKLMWHFQSHNRQSLQPISVSPALNLGTLVHKSLQSWIEGEGLPQDMLIGHAADMIDKVSEAYKTATGLTLQESERNGLYDITNLAHHMLTNYVAKYGTPLPKGYTLYEAEQTCIVPVPGIENAFLEATLDALVVNERGQLCLEEHKTYGSRPKIEVLDMNDQFLAYDWVLHQLFPNLDIGGVLYDGLWKRPAPPKGRTFDDLFFRHTFQHSKQELENYSNFLHDTVRDMMDNPSIYPNRQWMGCFDCRMDRLCRATIKGQDVDYIQSQYYMKREARIDFDIDPE